MQQDTNSTTTNPDPTPTTPEQAEKPTFRRLRDQHPFDVWKLGHDALTGPDSVYAMLRGETVSQADANLILRVFSRHAGSVYTLENTTIPVRKFGEVAP